MKNHQSCPQRHGALSLVIAHACPMYNLLRDNAWHSSKLLHDSAWYASFGMRRIGQGPLLATNFKACYVHQATSKHHTACGFREGDMYMYLTAFSKSPSADLGIAGKQVWQADHSVAIMPAKVWCTCVAQKMAEIQGRRHRGRKRKLRGGTMWLSWTSVIKHFERIMENRPLVTWYVNDRLIYGHALLQVTKSE